MHIYKMIHLQVLVVVSIFAVTFAFLLYTNLSTSLSNTRELMGSYEPEKVSTKFQDLQVKNCFVLFFAVA